jgi:hypothetical protein
VKRGILALCLLCAPLMIIGCGPGGPATVPVSGKVTKGGQGLPNITVSLIDAKNPNAPSAAGTTDSTGAFTIALAGAVTKNGAPAGSYKVVLTGGGTAPIAGTEGSKPQGYGQSGGAGGSTAPVLETPYDKKWGNYETSPQTVEVKAGMEPLDIKVD